MPRPTDAEPVAATLYLLPVATRVPLKFGPETLTHVTCARVRLALADGRGRSAEGWGETPLSVQWAWPSALPYDERQGEMVGLARDLTSAWPGSRLGPGHAIELGHRFLDLVLPGLHARRNAARPDREAMPWLAALIVASAFDQALHDAYGRLVDRPIYETYTQEYLSDDLDAYLEPDDPGVSFAGQHPADYLDFPRRDRLPAWHLVGGKDPVEPDDLTGDEPDDGYPVLLRDWVRADGLTCLKVKLRGDDPAWDRDRLAKVGRLAVAEGVEHLSADFNCTVTDPGYVVEVLRAFGRDQPAAFARLLYVEQPFPYDLEAHPIDVRAVSAIAPLFLDESAHDWRLVRLGRSLGWTGVALKTCKTQTGAILSQCWARAHGMPRMVQDLTNPMLAIIPHALLAAHAGTIAGVETNAMQFYPAASAPEAAVHPGLYRRRGGSIDLATVRGPGFGYRLAEIDRDLPAPSAEAGR